MTTKIRVPIFEPVCPHINPCILCGSEQGKWLAIPTHREREVLALVAQGFSNKMIAEELHLSLTTIKNHMTSIMRKMNARDRTMAVMVALEKDWIRKVEDN